MKHAGARRRLHDLLDFARQYRGWTRAQLARFLMRDPSRVYLSTDNPKADFIVRLAEALGWSADEVLDYIYAGTCSSAPLDETLRRIDDFEKLDVLAREAIERADFAQVLRIARRQLEVAQTADQRARAYNSEFGGWEGMGRYVRAIAAVRRGLAEAASLSDDVRLMLLSNLALAQLMLCDPYSARGASESILEWFEERGARGFRERRTLAFAMLVRGQAFLLLMTQEPGLEKLHAERARRDLLDAARRFSRLHREQARDWFVAYRRWAETGVLQARCVLGELQPRAVVDEFLGGLDAVRDVRQVESRPLLTGWGWCAVTIAAIALRHLPPAEAQYVIDVCCGKASEISDLVGDWGLRERAFMLGHELTSRIERETGLRLAPMLSDQPPQRGGTNAPVDLSDKLASRAVVASRLLPTGCPRGPGVPRGQT